MALQLRIPVVILILTLLLPLRGGAHGDLHEQIAILTKQIEQEPGLADLYLKRGRLHRAHRAWTSALEDFDRAAVLDPRLAIVDFQRGLTRLDAGEFAAARAALDRFVAAHPDHADALVARARALVGLGQRPAAVEDFTRAIARLERPRPEHYVERARALAAEGPPFLAEALRGLDAGIARLGPVPALELLAMDLELELQRYDSALERVTRLSATSPRKEVWMARRGVILVKAGRIPEARAAYASSLAALEALPDAQRRTWAMAELDISVRAALERLERDR